VLCRRKEGEGKGKKGQLVSQASLALRLRFSAYSARVWPPTSSDSRKEGEKAVGKNEPAKPPHLDSPTRS
jgi:hypothetical protein